MKISGLFELNSSFIDYFLTKILVHWMIILKANFINVNDLVISCLSLYIFIFIGVIRVIEAFLTINLVYGL